MNKRLRKKKRVGEFKELGFELLGDLRPAISDHDIEAFVDRLIDFVESRMLGFGGGGGRDGKFEGFVTRMGRGSATEDIAQRSPHSSSATMPSFVTRSACCATLGTVGIDRAGRRALPLTHQLREAAPRGHVGQRRRPLGSERDQREAGPQRFATT